MKSFGNRVEVYAGLAVKTKGGLRREDLVMNLDGTIGSKRLSDANKARWAQGGARAFGKTPKEDAAEVVAEPTEPAE